jgi:hypothetical protein
MSLRRTISELPHFTVTVTKQLEASNESSPHFALSGIFDRIRGVKEGEGWLFLPERTILCGDIQRLNLDERTATFLTEGDPEIDITGESLPFLDGCWKGYHVLMVSEPAWVWTRILFQAQDAVAEMWTDEDGSEWAILRMKHVEGVPNVSYRVYPNIPDIAPDGTVIGGWDHEHCELCEAHIEPEQFGYVDRGNHWVCEKCYTTFVSVHDISFLETRWPEAF